MGTVKTVTVCYIFGDPAEFVIKLAAGDGVASTKNDAAPYSSGSASRSKQFGPDTGSDQKGPDTQHRSRYVPGEGTVNISVIIMEE
jgi:hypothetical protein